MMAGRDIVNSGTSHDEPLPVPGMFGADTMANSMGNLFTHGSIMTFPSSAPGATSCAATSSWPARRAGSRGRPSSPGRGQGQPDHSGAGGRRRRVLARPSRSRRGRGRPRLPRPAGLLPGGAADPSRPLADQGRPFKTYEAELLLWPSSATRAPPRMRAYLALPPEQQRIFARQIYFAERAGGREYNARDSAGAATCAVARRSRRCSRSRAAMAWRASDGDITLYGGTGLRSIVGGDIQVLSPGGRQVYGVEAVPPASAGVVTQGAGEIRSRPAQHPAGAEPDHDDVRRRHPGVVCRRRHQRRPGRQDHGGVRRRGGSMTRSASRERAEFGRGIATLAPIAEVPAGDVDRMRRWARSMRARRGSGVSGNINIAALHVVNAANIQVKGESNGIPAAATVNTGGWRRQRGAGGRRGAGIGAARPAAVAPEPPSVISVQILGMANRPPRPRPSRPGQPTGRTAWCRCIDGGG